MSRKTRGLNNTIDNSPAATQKNLLNSYSSSIGNYINKQANHLAFNKTKIGYASSMKNNTYDSGVISKPLRAPEKPLLPNIKYHHRIVEHVRERFPELRNSEISKVITNMWQDLPEKEKQVYKDEYENEKKAYHEVLKIYQSSNSFQGYGRGRGRVDTDDMYDKQLKRENTTGSIFLEALVDESGEMDYSVKHASGYRFGMCHRLMSDILSDMNTVPTGEGIVTSTKLDSKRRQVEILNKHCNNLSKDVIELEKKHEAKKRKWRAQQDEHNKKMKAPLNTDAQDFSYELKLTSYLYGLIPNTNVFATDMVCAASKNEKLLAETKVTAKPDENKFKGENLEENKCIQNGSFVGEKH